MEIILTKSERTDGCKIPILPLQGREGGSMMYKARDNPISFDELHEKLLTFEASFQNSKKISAHVPATANPVSRSGSNWRPQQHHNNWRPSFPGNTNWPQSSSPANKPPTTSNSPSNHGNSQPPCPYLGRCQCSLPPVTAITDLLPIVTAVAPISSSSPVVVVAASSRSATPSPLTFESVSQATNVDTIASVPLQQPLSIDGSHQLLKIVAFTTIIACFMYEPLKLDIVISFPDHGFHLRFDPWSQGRSSLFQFPTSIQIVAMTHDRELHNARSTFEQACFNLVLTYAQQSREMSNYEQAAHNHERMQEYKRQID
ncbi:hypothetical protein Ddye_025451 [Dipteronia dyeriana]|uniref:Uncharacterized protein n=1 Tax=Dipteronia dyeriana TaxID=168575 RepID=A0AAD9TKV0_9ROSI|nr:hypothetical protein Ddye_025451 [Dipteronia dyeriana]